MIIFYNVLINLAFFIAGYLFIGSFNTSIILSYFFKKDDVRKYHSQNAGATNSLRTFGKRFALIVFIIDFLKVVLTVLIAALIVHNIINVYFPFQVFVSPQVAGFGVVVGHIFPIYFKFKGGKGVVCAASLILMINVIAFIIASIIFFSILVKRKIVSLASISVALVMLPMMYNPWFTQGILGFWINNVEHNDDIIKFLVSYWYVTPIIFTLTALLVIIMHHSNIKRLIKKEERTLNLNKE
ncbi:glycerol-3-phosphate 1-O-acyltransferase PlsY [Mycoplasma sp. 1018B]|uniref:glycerol-3-phosphate 1-O-acyltransferase PlsY n=1 Tax=Mycoplasma sp. 1018B TaxID=2967302 RepID=UPI00211BE057|nr:glycerol-3-phosphate 1-O-acyltransferase PlsY [Mycoplasma sp. 1018B]UUM19470.1 glycerol-3-phosphate 1-O-acyltransferase PlsY [Mycoplasma sp. 1018B]